MNFAFTTLAKVTRTLVCLPEPKLLLHTAYGKILEVSDLPATPEWAKPVSPFSSYPIVRVIAGDFVRSRASKCLGQVTTRPEGSIASNVTGV